MLKVCKGTDCVVINKSFCSEKYIIDGIINEKLFKFIRTTKNLEFSGEEEKLYDDFPILFDSFDELFYDFGTPDIYNCFEREGWFVFFENFPVTYC